MKRFGFCMIVLIGLLSFTEIDAQVTRPSRRSATSRTTRPTSKPVKPAAEISPEARIFFSKLDTVYSTKRPIRFIAHITGDFDIAGRAKKYSLEIDSLTDGNGRFIHRAEPAGVVQQNDRELYLYDKKRNAYGYLKSPATRPASDKLTSEVADILIDENPSLLMSLVTDPTAALTAEANKVSTDGPILVISNDETDRKFTLDQSGYLQSITIDFSPAFQARKTQGVKSALVTITYESPVFDVPIQLNSFDFTPPENAAQSDLVRETESPTTQTVTTKPTSDN